MLSLHHEPLSAPSNTRTRVLASGGPRPIHWTMGARWAGQDSNLRVGYLTYGQAPRRCATDPWG